MKLRGSLTSSPNSTSISCRHETGKGIAEYAKEVMGEPERPVSLKTAAKESREASAALAGNDAHEDIGQDAR